MHMPACIIPLLFGSIIVQKNIQNITSMKDITAKPGPFALFGVGITALLLGVEGTGLFPFNTMLFALCIFSAGISQLIAGYMEWRRNSLFGTTTSLGYGFFFISLGTLKLLNKTVPAMATEGIAMAAFLAGWGLITVVVFIAALRRNRVNRIIFASLASLLFLMAVKDATGLGGFGLLGGIMGIVTGIAVLYNGSAEFLNAIYGRVMLPLGEVVTEKDSAAVKPVIVRSNGNGNGHGDALPEPLGVIEVLASFDNQPNAEA